LYRHSRRCMDEYVQHWRQSLLGRAGSRPPTFCLQWAGHVACPITFCAKKICINFDRVNWNARCCLSHNDGLQSLVSVCLSLSGFYSPLLKCQVQVSLAKLSLPSAILVLWTRLLEENAWLVLQPDDFLAPHQPVLWVSLLSSRSNGPCWPLWAG
jgi:hypothetical protein